MALNSRATRSGRFGTVCARGQMSSTMALNSAATRIGPLRNGWRQRPDEFYKGWRQRPGEFYNGPEFRSNPKRAASQRLVPEAR